MFLKICQLLGANIYLNYLGGKYFLNLVIDTKYNININFIDNLCKQNFLNTEVFQIRYQLLGIDS